MDRSNIEKIAQTSEDKILLAKLWDKIQTGIRKNIPVCSCFLSPREQMLANYLFGNVAGLTSYGGYEDAERKMLCYLPDYMPEDSYFNEDVPLVCLRANFFQEDTPTHRDFLGALIGCGIARECIGDICIGETSCNFFVTAEIAPWLLQNLLSAGRTRLSLQAIPLNEVQVPATSVKEIRDTVASLRLDSVISSGFRISRAIAVQHILAGRAAINGLPCEKPDKTVDADTKISVRGLGKIRLKEIGGQTKKGRISLIIERYL